MHTDTNTRTNSLRYDSTYHRDSIYIREYTRGDTVYLDRWHDRWRDRTITRTDTVYRDREVVVQQPPERYVPGVVRGLAWIGAIAIGVGVVALLKKLGIRN